MNDSQKTKTKRRRWPWVMGGILLLVVSWQLMADLFRKEEKQMRRQLRETLNEKYPQKAAEFFNQFGLFRYEVHREVPIAENLK
jgi:hypothetical protein